MGFLSLIIALLVEQVRPLRARNPAYQAVRNAADAVERNFNAGEKQQGVLAWLVLVVPLTLLTWLAYALLLRAHPFLGLAWNALVVYVTLGFRQFSHYYTDIQLALADNDLERARALLTEWKRETEPSFSAADLALGDLCRLAIEEALVASHRHVFGVFFWFVLLPGPSGAVLYRLADFLARRWNAPAGSASAALAPLEPFGLFPKRAFEWIDWLPVRFTAVGFAIVGNFEDAVFNWRNHVEQWSDPARGILLAAGGGALGVRIGQPGGLQGGLHSGLNTGDAARAFTDPAAAPVAAGYDAGSDPGSDAIAGADPWSADASAAVEASPAALRSGVGLVWRSLLLWMLLLLLLSLAGLFG